MAKEKMASIEQIQELRTLYNNVFDSYSNYALSQGAGTTDFLNATQYLANNRKTWDINTIMQVEREEPLFRKILNYRASNALNGIDINSKGMPSEEIKYIKRSSGIYDTKIYRHKYESLFEG